MHRYEHIQSNKFSLKILWSAPPTHEKQPSQPVTDTHKITRHKIIPLSMPFTTQYPQLPTNTPTSALSSGQIQTLHIITANHTYRRWGEGGGCWLSAGLERWIGDPKAEGSNPVRSSSKKLWVFPSQTGCADSLSVCPTPVCMKDHGTHGTDPVVHVRVRWIIQKHENHQHALVPPNTVNVAAQVTEEFKTVTLYATPGKNKNKQKKT